MTTGPVGGSGTHPVGGGGTGPGRITDPADRRLLAILCALPIALSIVLLVSWVVAR